MTIIFLSSGGELNRVDYYYGALAGFLCIAGLAYVFDWLHTARVWLHFRSNSQLYTQPYRAHFDEHKMTADRGNASSTTKWNYYQAAIEGNQEFILIYGKDRYYTIPKASFQNQADIEAFRTILRNQVAFFRQMLNLPMDFRQARSAT